MTDAVDTVTAGRQALRACGDLSDLIDGRVYGGEVPGADADVMPRGCIVVANAGGGGSGVGASDTRAWTRGRIDVRSYGETPAEAAAISVMAHLWLKQWTRRVANGVLIDTVEEGAGPISFRDPNTDWPMTIRTYLLLHADRLVS